MTELNEAQRAVVTFSDGATQILCSACPGSGKTRTLIERIAHEIEANGIHPSAIVVITFTNAAADELKKRLGERMGWVGLNHLGYCGTLHSYMVRLIKEHGQWIGMTNKFTVIDQEQTDDLLQSAIEEMKYRGPLLALSEAVSTWETRDKSAPMNSVALTAAAFYQMLRRENFLTFDMILARGLDILKAGALIGKTHLFVDEFQDSGDLDAAIYEAMPCGFKFFVGDQNQSIYGFRGAKVQHFTDMMRRGDTAVFSLTENYRCDRAIVTVANCLVGGRMTSATGGDGMIQFLSAETAELEVVQVAEVLKRDLQYTEDIAVLVRTNKLVEEWSIGLENMGIPVRQRKLSGLPADWKWTKTYVALLCNPENDRLAYLVLKESQGVLIADQWKSESLKKLKSINQVVLHLPAQMHIASAVMKLAEAGISAESYQIVKRIAATLPADSAPEDLMIAMNLEDVHGEEMGEGVLVTTLHSGKGREFGIVVMPSFEQEITPRKLDQVDEERRLAYVGVTRAKHKLILSYAKRRRQRWGNGQHAPANPSQFIEEMLRGTRMSVGELCG